MSSFIAMSINIRSFEILFKKDFILVILYFIKLMFGSLIRNISILYSYDDFMTNITTL